MMGSLTLERIVDKEIHRQAVARATAPFMRAMRRILRRAKASGFVGLVERLQGLRVSQDFDVATLRANATSQYRWAIEDAGRAADALEKYVAAMAIEDDRQRESRSARAAREFDRHFPGGSARVIKALEQR